MWKTGSPIARSSGRLAANASVGSAHEHRDLSRCGLVDAAGHRSLERGDRRARRRAPRAGAARGDRSCSCRSTSSPRSGRRGARRRRRPPPPTAAGEGRHVITRVALLGHLARRASPRGSRREQIGRSVRVCGRAPSAGSRPAARSRQGGRRDDRRRRTRRVSRTGLSGQHLQMQRVVLVGVTGGDLLVQLDTEAGTVRAAGRIRPPSVIGVFRISAWKPPQVWIPSRTRKFGAQRLSWMFAAPTTGPL